MVQVLLVDDDKDILKYVKMLLETKDYHVTTCLDARDGIEQLTKNEFDIVLSDANMPGGISGFDLVKTVRGMEKYQDVGMALLTARRDKKDVERALELGVDDYIVKPIDPEILFAKVDGLLKKRPPVLRPEFTFAEANTSYSFTLEVKAEAEGITEMGLSFVGSMFLEEGSQLKVNSPLFAEIGIESPRLKVVKSQLFEKDKKELFKTHTSFVGLNEGDLQKIRKWVHYHSLYGNKKVS